MTPKNAAAVALGRRGGQATAQKLSPEERKQSARRAAEARWAKAEKQLTASHERLDAAMTKLDRARARRAKRRIEQ